MRSRHVSAAFAIVALAWTGGCWLRQAARDLASTFSDEAFIPPPDAQAFFTAARRGDVVGIGAALAKGVDVNAVEPVYQRTAIMRAAAFNHVAAVESLLKAGTRVDVVDLDGDTCFMSPRCPEPRM